MAPEPLWERELKWNTSVAPLSQKFDFVHPDVVFSVGKTICHSSMLLLICGYFMFLVISETTIDRQGDLNPIFDWKNFRKMLTWPLSLHLRPELTFCLSWTVLLPHLPHFVAVEGVLAIIHSSGNSGLGLPESILTFKAVSVQLT